jgi:hypothetical protein
VLLVVLVAVLVLRLPVLLLEGTHQVEVLLLLVPGLPLVLLLRLVLLLLEDVSFTL